MQKVICYYCVVPEMERKVVVDLNKYKLLDAASNAGIKTISSLSETANIPKSVLSAKLNGHRAFNTTEIEQICKALNIRDNALKADIFLS